MRAICINSPGRARSLYWPYLPYQALRTLPATLPIVHSFALLSAARGALSRLSRLSNLSALSRRMSNLLGQRQRDTAAATVNTLYGSTFAFPFNLSLRPPTRYLPEPRPYPITTRTLSPSSRRARDRAEIRVEPEYVEYALCDRRVVALLLFYCHFARTKRRSR